MDMCYDYPSMMSRGSFCYAHKGMHRVGESQFYLLLSLP
jgi:hypothetical protein